MTADELIELAKKRQGDGHYQEALALANAAIEIDPENADAWWRSALARSALEDLVNALPAFAKTVQFAPRFAYGWARYGQCLWRLGHDDRAQEALERALEFDADEDDALATLADLYGKKKDEANQFKVLTHLAATKGVSPPRFAALDFLTTPKNLVFHRRGHIPKR